MRRTGWRVTPASVLPTLVAFVLAGVLGLPGGSPLTGTPLTGTPLTGSPLAGSAGPAVSTETVAQARTQAPASGTMSTAADTARVAHTGPTTPSHAGPGAALAALAYRLSIDRPGRLLSTPAGGHPAGTDFSSFRSRAPPLTS